MDLGRENGESQHARCTRVLVFARHHLREKRLQHQTHRGDWEIPDGTEEFLEELREERHFGGIVRGTADDGLQELL